MKSVFLFLAFLPFAAQAGTESHGGDEIGLQFQQAVESSLREIQSGMPELQAKVAGAKLGAIAEKAQVVVVDTPLKVTVDGLEQESVAVNNAAKNQILINRARWNGILNYHTREGIALHEVASLAKLETTGAYPISGKYVAKFNVSPAALYSVAPGSSLVNSSTLCPEPAPTAKDFFTLIGNPRSTVEEVRNYLNNSIVAVDAMNSQCETPLLFATRLRRTEIFGYLYDLYGRPDVNALTSNRVQVSLYQYGLYYGDMQTIETLRRFGGKLPSWGIPEFFLVAERNSPDVVEAFLKNGANVQEQAGPEFPLNRAAAMNSKEVIALLLKYGAKVNLGYPLVNAARTNTAEAVRTLIMAGAQVNPALEEKLLRQTPLMAAAAENLKPEVTSLLIQAGALVNVQNYLDEGLSPLMYSARINTAEVIRVLLQAGADVNQESNRQIRKEGRTTAYYTAYDYAVESRRGSDILNLLKPMRP